MIPNRLAAVAAIAALTTPALAQVNLKTGLEAGRTLSYDVSQSLVVQQRNAPDAEPVNYASLSEAVVVLTVNSVDENGTARVTAEIAAFKARLEDAGGPTSVNFDMEKDEDPAGLATLEVFLTDATIAFEVSPQGRVETIAGLDDFYAALLQSQGTSPELFSFFKGEVLAELFSKIFYADGGIGERNIGDSWDTSRRVPLGSGGAIEVSTRSSLQIAQDDFAAFAGITTCELFVPRERAENVPTVSLSDATGQVLSRWDLQNGALISRFSLYAITLDWSRADLRAITSQKAEIRIERR